MPQGCLSCGASGVREFYAARAIPVHSCVMLDDARAAAAYPTRDLALGFCPACGFIGNVAFDPATAGTVQGYEEQQSFSPRFREFQSSLVARLVGHYGVRGADVVEIGCGKGDFLLELCAAGGNRGVGIDPACDPQRVAGRAGGQVRFLAESFAPSHAELACDLMCCRHTLEHVPGPRDFVRLVRRVLGDRTESRIFFEVPDTVRVLREQAFWDIYYEHCAYFTPGSLARLFRANGFEVLELRKDYDDQYLLVVARPVKDPPPTPHPSEESVAELAHAVDTFARGVRDRFETWRRRLADWRAAKRRLVIWGSGSKCVSFLSAVDGAAAVTAVVDINPFRQGKYLAGSGQQIVAPERLKAIRPDIVLVMNPIYVAEIQQTVHGLGLQAEFVTV